jgi:hypothetical protein
MSRDARVWEGRGDGVLGGHTANQNAGNMALCIIGTYTTDTLTPQQECAAAGWMAWMGSRHGIALNRTNIKGHREWGATACPGDQVFARLNAIVQQAATTCAGQEPQRPAWGGEFVGQSYPGAHVMAVTLEEGQSIDGWVELRNIGTQTWTTAATRLAPTPRDQASPLAAANWLSPTRVSNVLASTPTGAVGRFPLRLRGNRVGSYRQTFGLLHEGVTWFADQGGPADTFITVRVEVVPRPVVDAGTPAVDAGSPVVDAGTPVVDAGLPTVDAGTETPDAGAQEPTEEPGVGDEPLFLDAVPNGVALLQAPMEAQGGCSSVGPQLALALSLLLLRARGSRCETSPRRRRRSE